MNIYRLGGFLVIFLLFTFLCVISFQLVNRSSYKNRYIYLALFWLLASGFFSALVSAWPSVYAELRLAYLGAGLSFEPAAWIDSVAVEHRSEALKLYSSNMGVGWPIPAMFLYVFVGIPWSILFTLVAKYVSSSNVGKT